MKANRKFVETDEAVSPVIAVILMVAITVVLAATVFVLVSDIGSQTGKTAPAFALTQDESNDRLTVSSAASGADWNRLVIKGSKEAPDGASFALNLETAGAATETAITIAGVEITGGVDPMTAGEFLDLCGTATATNLKLTLIDLSANQIMGEWTFLNFGLCA